MNWELIITVVCACLGSSGLFAFITFLITRKDSKSSDLVEIRNSIAEIEKRVKKSEISDVQTQLLILIAHHPHDHKAIFAVADYYFGVLHQDSWVIFQMREWAKEEDVDISPIEELHRQNIKQK